MTGKIYADKNDFTNAIFWLERAQANGNSDAKSLLTEVENKKLESERKVRNAIAKKEEEKKEAKKREETTAMKMIKADSFFEQKMYSDAYSNYIDAAKKGDARAQSRIAWMLYKGKGVSKDKTAAYDWWRKAARQGDTEAINYLTRLGRW